MEPAPAIDNHPVLHIYMVKEGNLWVELNSEEPVANHQLTRVLRTTFDRESHPAMVGERLYYHQLIESSPWQEYLVIPSDWVVTKVISYRVEEAFTSPEFPTIQVVYCDSQPLPAEEIKRLTYTVVPDKVADAHKGDQEAYRAFLQTDEAKRYVIRHQA
jgi:hypothetical protein